MTMRGSSASGCVSRCFRCGAHAGRVSIRGLRAAQAFRARLRTRGNLLPTTRSRVCADRPKQRSTSMQSCSSKWPRAATFCARGSLHYGRRRLVRLRSPRSSPRCCKRARTRSPAWSGLVPRSDATVARCMRCPRRDPSPIQAGASVGTASRALICPVVGCSGSLHSNPAAALAKISPLLLLRTKPGWSHDFAHDLGRVFVLSAPRAGARRVRRQVDSRAA